MHAPLMIDVAGLRLSPRDRLRLAHPLVGGVILFGRNWQDRAQLSHLCAQIKRVRADLLIAVDHEGGRVQRFRRDGFTPLPSMRRLGEMWMDDHGGEGQGALRAMEAATAVGHVLATELRACGVDFSFTPVLDLDWGPSTVIGDRAFHADARVVTVLARSLILGLAQAGMRACGKHFPGHGWVQADSHVDVPVDDRSLAAIWQDDVQPYAHLRTALDAVMPAHVIYPQVDDRPAGFSRRWIQGLLREELGMDACVFSDDLSMQGARQLDGLELSFTAAAEAALGAGCDMALLCNQSVPEAGRALDELIDGLSEAVVSGRWRPDPRSEQRRLRLLPQAPALSWDALMHDVRYQQALEQLPG